MKKYFGLIFTFLILSSGSMKLNAQVNRFLLNIPNHDKKQLHFGFILGLTSNTLDVTFSKNLLESNVKRTEVLNFSGFNVGVLADYRLNKDFNLRFVPSLTLSKRAIDFTYTNPVTLGSSTQVLNKSDEIALFNLPISLKFRAQRRGNFRPYVFGGTQLSLDMSSAKNIDDPTVLRLNSTDFGLHAGLGMDFYLEYFKFGFEMRYNYGLTDLRVTDGGVYYETIESVYNRGLQFCLTFE
ncbi:MAG: porin family protein [Flavobacteriales bacterium]